MRKSPRHLAPLAVVVGLHMACSSTDTRRTFEADPTHQDAGSDATSGNTFDTVDAGAADAQEACSETKSEIQRVPIVLEFAVDESGSMSSSGKWTAARDALLGAFSDMKAAADPGVFVGVLLWSDSVGDKVAPGAITDANHYNDLVDLVDIPSPTGGGTVMSSGLTAAYNAVEAFKAPAGFVQDQVNRAVVVVSDGAPADSDKTICLNLVESKFNEQPPAGPVLTFAVGIGEFPSTSTSTYDPAFMSRIAQKGGSAPAGCLPTSLYAADLCHFQITPSGTDGTAAKQALVDAINKIRAATISCEFTFTRNASTDINDVRVEITDADGNTTEIPKDEDDGWSFDDPDDPTKVILHGDSCSGTSGTLSGNINVILGCRQAN